MKFERIKRIHFVGISGIGMSGIAEVLLNMGFKISGSDLRETPITERLSSLGIKVSKGHSPSNIENAELLVCSSAVPEGNPEILEAKRRGIPVISRGEMLAELTRLKDSLIVSGSHGKTTTTAMLGHISRSLNLDPTLIIGGRLSSIASSATLGKSNLLIAEADESDRSFLLLHPSLAVITNIDWEHIDTYPTPESLKDAYIDFANKVPFYGSVVCCNDDFNVREVIPQFKRRTITYGMLPGSEWSAERIKGNFKGEKFVVKRKDEEIGVAEIKQLGTHNILNSLGAIAAFSEMEVNLEEAIKSLSTFPGVDRRFELKGIEKGIEIYDDYAHHPSELKALIETARLAGGNRRLVIIFEPHRYSRLKAFEDNFAKVLLLSDLVVITDVYSAGEPPLEGITGEALFKRLKELSHTNCYYCKNISEVPVFVLPLLNENDLVVTVGAGNVTKVGGEILKLLRGNNESF
jgi:UDP-N-acetylmuramate--alanine ligase